MLNYKKDDPDEDYFSSEVFFLYIFLIIFRHGMVQQWMFTILYFTVYEMYTKKYLHILDRYHLVFSVALVILNRICSVYKDFFN
jgi:hypothetical protein